MMDDQRSPDAPEEPAASGSPAEQLRSLEELIVRSEANGVVLEPGVRMLLERLREVIAAVEQFEASLNDAPTTE